MSAWSHSCGPVAQGGKSCTLAVEAGDQLAAKADAQAVIEQLVHEHRAASEMKPVAKSRQLQRELPEDHGVVVCHDPLVLGGDEQSHVDPGQMSERVPWLWRLHGEAAVEVGDEGVVEIAVGLRV